MLRLVLRSLPVLMTLLLCSACGGGSASDGALDPGSSPSAYLTGEVLSIDGQTTSLAGVVLYMPEKEQTVTTAADGSFSFGAVPLGTLSLDLVVAPSSAMKADDAGSNGQGGSGPYSDDEIDDGEDADDDGVHVHRVRAQERIHVRLRIQDGECEEMDCAREQNQECETERRMERTGECDDADLTAKVEVEQRQDRECLRVRVERSDEGRQLELRIQARTGEHENQGTCVADADGTCQWSTDTSTGGRLPFAAGGVCDLAGCKAEILDYDTGAVLLTTDVPEVPPYRYRNGEDQGQGDQDRDRISQDVTAASQASAPPDDIPVRNQQEADRGSGDLDRDRDQDGAGAAGAPPQNQTGL